MKGKLHNKLQQIMQPIKIIVLARKYKLALVLRPCGVCGSDAFVMILNIEIRTPANILIRK